jgi:DtxR family Mn-dependent transcriptional regulator
MPWDEVHEEAHRLEHATSDRLADRLAEFLEQPQVDPHGQRIPSSDGTLPHKAGRPLTDIVAGQWVQVLEVPDGDPALLRFLAACGLQPGAEVRVENPPQTDAPLVVQVGGASCAVERQAARRILVAEVDHLPGGQRE